MNGDNMNRNAADALRETANTLRGMAAAVWPWRRIACRRKWR